MWGEGRRDLRIAKGRALLRVTWLVSGRVRIPTQVFGLEVQGSFNSYDIGMREAKKKCER